MHSTKERIVPDAAVGIGRSFQPSRRSFIEFLMLLFLVFVSMLKGAAKEKQESNLDELTENTGDEEQPELSPQTNEEEVEQPEGVEETGKEEFVGGEVRSPLKGEGSDDDPNRWDEYKFDF
ncbi:uncharacterized protein E6C27_scaffold21G001650 [Cucumis melo var. makuwa]|uniref:Uncharacterized protein n=1 Tax=Cucumis melo var. makuwa TaxID=1194695 RepID=A0A5A7VLG6_CUCMM|nr:uncharacterized protein E6C27_scaffold21G001650 [Cucumis melo var. makuwa]